MGVTRKKLESRELSQEELDSLDCAAALNIEYDEEDPELDADGYAEMAKMARMLRAERKRQAVSLRLLPETVRKAKKLGKGYTGVLSRLLDLAIDDPEMVRKCL